MRGTYDKEAPSSCGRYSNGLQREASDAHMHRSIKKGYRTNPCGIPFFTMKPQEVKPKVQTDWLGFCKGSAQ